MQTVDTGKKCTVYRSWNRRKNFQKLYRTVNELCGKFKPNVMGINDRNGQMLDNITDIGTRYGRSFFGGELYVNNNNHNRVDETVD